MLPEGYLNSSSSTTEEEGEEEGGEEDRSAKALRSEVDYLEQVLTSEDFDLHVRWVSTVVAMQVRMATSILGGFGQVDSLSHVQRAPSPHIFYSV